MKTVWSKTQGAEREALFAFNEAYKHFISVCKTERECVKETVRLAEENGYRDLNAVLAAKEKIQAGDKFYAVNKDKDIALFVIGSEPLEAGMNIVGAHIDSPRLDLKQHPIYEDQGLTLLDTHYYGGIKKYQWVAHPMALHGVVFKKDGTRIDLNIGEDDNDPVVGISDLLVHLSADQMQKTGAKVVEGEDLNVLVGSIPAESDKEEKEPVKKAILVLLKEKYNIEEDDFLSAEIEVVPAGKARDYGLDCSLVLGYGHDDRVCAYTSALATFAMENPQRTSVCLLVDKEEVGSNGASGMHSHFFENTVAEILNAMGDYSELKVRRALQNSKMLSSDVSAGYDPNYPSVNEMKNTAFLGKGIVFNKYTGSRGKSGCNDANPEFIAELRRIMEEENVMFQTAELGRVDQGGGGTIAYILANYNMEVIDAGIAVQNMHAPWEVVSKADVYEAYRAYIAFLKKA